MNPKISIVVPIYKVPEEYLRKCIESLQEQTLKDIEIILVNDGSPDNCGQICDEYGNSDSRIVVIHKENAGLAAARNTGEEVATGEWISFVDGDDWLECNACEVAYEVGEKYKVDIVCWGYIRDYKNKSDKYNYSKYFQDGKVYEGDECSFFQEMTLNFNSHISTVYAKLIRKKFLTDNNISHDSVLRQGWEGIEFCVRLFGRAMKILFLNKYWYHYTYNPKSISSMRGEENTAYVIECIKKIKSEISNYSNWVKLEKWLKNRVLYFVVATAISDYFSPDNFEPYSERKSKFNRFLENSVIKEAMKEHNWDELSTSRKLILFFVEKRFYIALELFGKLRKFQKIVYGAK